MDSKKYEQLINLIINEDEDKAKELFHEIVVEQSREIYESIMAEEMMGGQVGDLLDEISAEEAGVTEDDNEFGDEFGSEELIGGDDFESEEVFDLGSEEEFGDEGAESEEVEDAVIRIEDKLDQLMAEFEEIMGADDSMDMDSGEDFDAEEVEVDSEEEVEVDADDEVMEAVQLQKVSVSHGDDGSQKRSPVAANAGKAGMDSKPVDFAGGDEKGRSAPQSKDLKGAGSFKNAPGGKAKVDLASAPKPVTKDGSAGGKSPVAK